MPDGSIITLDEQMRKLPLKLFSSPENWEHDFIDVKFDSFLTKLDPDIKNEVTKNIFLVGGTAEIPGIERMIIKRIRSTHPNLEFNLEQRNASSRHLIPWKGAALMGKLKDVMKFLHKDE